MTGGSRGGDGVGGRLAAYSSTRRARCARPRTRRWCAGRSACSRDSYSLLSLVVTRDKAINLSAPRHGEVRWALDAFPCLRLVAAEPRLAPGGGLHGHGLSPREVLAAPVRRKEGSRRDTRLRVT